jgi:hypothetical protein
MPSTSARALQRDWVIEHEDELVVGGDAALAVIVSRLPATPFLSVVDVCESLDISRYVVYRWLEAGAFRYLESGSGKTNKHYAILRDSFIEFLKSKIR